MPAAQEATLGRTKKQKWRSVAMLVTIGLLVVAIGVYALRASLLGFVAHSYLASQGVSSAITIDAFDSEGLVAHGSLGSNKEISVGRLRLTFAPGRWIPLVTKAEIDSATLHLSVAPDRIAVGSLQPWLNRLLRTQRPAQNSRFLGENAAIIFRHVTLAASTFAGPLVVEASAQLEGSQLIAADATLRPARVHFGSTFANVAGGLLRLKAAPHGLGLNAGLRALMSGEVDGIPFRLGMAQFSAEIPELQWAGAPRGQEFAMPAASLTFAAENGSVRGKLLPVPPSLVFMFRNFLVASTDGRVRSSGDVMAKARGSLAAADANAWAGPMSALGAKPDVARKLVAALTSLNLAGSAAWDSSSNAVRLTWSTPIALESSNGFVLHILPFAKTGEIRIDSSGLAARFAADVKGPGIGSAEFGFYSLAWKNPSQPNGAFALSTQLDFGAFQGVSLGGVAHISSDNDAVSLGFDRCARVRVHSWMMNGKTVLRNVQSDVCPAGALPLLRFSKEGWSGSVSMARSQFDVVGAGAQLAGGAGISFAGNLTGLQTSDVEAAVQLSDMAKSRRFERLSFRAHLRLDHRAWRGDGTIETGKRVIGTFALSHDLPSRTGHLVIASKDVVFAPNALKPVDLSPILSRLAQADGGARFEGRIDWSGNRIRSNGRLDVDDLEFASPLGATRRLQTHLAFASLLPPKTAPDQEITIERVEWVSPLTDIETRLSFDASELRIGAARTELAGGTVSLEPLTVGLKATSTTKSAANVEHLDLGALIANSNLGAKLKFEGTVSGHLPFSFGPEGIRFAGGRIAGDGPGRLLIDPSLWGDTTPDAAEKFAYKALQNLAFDTLSATADSEPGGRLRMVFHIIGHTEAPGTNELKILDLIQGNAFQSEIPLPQGTPIDLTLDTSLNFDELLRGYEAAWSEATSHSKGSP